jgi:hypothetical protein
MNNILVEGRKNQGLKARRAPLMVSILLATTGWVAIAHAGEPDPMAILKSMSDYLAAQSEISATFDSSLEVITPELEKIQFNSSTVLQLKRPDKLKIERVGGYSAVDVVFDGKTVSVHDIDGKTYAQIPAEGTIDALVDHMRAGMGISAPGADLIQSNVFGNLSEDVLSAKYIGQGVIGDVECEHLAFRNVDTDWQLWVRTGAAPIPCKMVITSKAVAGGPQYTLEIRKWASGEATADATFEFKPDIAEAKVEPEKLAGLDEVPTFESQGAGK